MTHLSFARKAISVSISSFVRVVSTSIRTREVRCSLFRNHSHHIPPWSMSTTLFMSTLILTWFSPRHPLTMPCRYSLPCIQFSNWVSARKVVLFASCILCSTATKASCRIPFECSWKRRRSISFPNKSSEWQWFLRDRFRIHRWNRTATHSRNLRRRSLHSKLYWTTTIRPSPIKHLSQLLLSTTSNRICICLLMKIGKFHPLHQLSAAFVVSFCVGTSIMARPCRPKARSHNVTRHSSNGSGRRRTLTHVSFIVLCQMHVNHRCIELQLEIVVPSPILQIRLRSFSRTNASDDRSRNLTSDQLNVFEAFSCVSVFFSPYFNSNVSHHSPELFPLYFICLCPDFNDNLS